MKKIKRILGIPTVCLLTAFLFDPDLFLSSSIYSRWLTHCDKNAIITPEQALTGMTILTAQESYGYGDGEDEEEQSPQFMPSRSGSSAYGSNPAEPTDITLCRALLSRSSTNIEPTRLTLQEQPNLCVDWTAPHISLLQIIASSVITGTFGATYGLDYTHDCHLTIPVSNSPRAAFDGTTIQQIFPGGDVHIDARIMQQERILRLCSGCVEWYETLSDAAKHRPKERIAHHCLVYPNYDRHDTSSLTRSIDGQQAATEGLLMTTEGQGIESQPPPLLSQQRDSETATVLEAALRQIKNRLIHSAIDYSGKSNAPSKDGTSGVVIFMDGTSQYVKPHVVLQTIPSQAEKVHILLHPTCADHFVYQDKKNDEEQEQGYNNVLLCMDYARNLKQYILNNAPTSITEIGLYIVGSTAALNSRMVLTKTLVCLPGTIGCLIPALTKEGNKVAYVLEGPEEKATSATGWFTPLSGLVNVVVKNVMLEDMIPVFDDLGGLMMDPVAVEMDATAFDATIVGGYGDGLQMMENTEGNVEGNVGLPAAAAVEGNVGGTTEGLNVDDVPPPNTEGNIVQVQLDVDTNNGQQQQLLSPFDKIGRTGENQEYVEEELLFPQGGEEPPLPAEISVEIGPAQPAQPPQPPPPPPVQEEPPRAPPIQQVEGAVTGEYPMTEEEQLPSPQDLIVPEEEVGGPIVVEQPVDQNQFNIETAPVNGEFPVVNAPPAAAATTTTEEEEQVAPPPPPPPPQEEETPPPPPPPQEQEVQQLVITEGNTNQGTGQQQQQSQSQPPVITEGNTQKGINMEYPTNNIEIAPSSSSSVETSPISQGANTGGTTQQQQEKKKNTIEIAPNSSPISMGVNTGGTTQQHQGKKKDGFDLGTKGTVWHHG